MANEAQLVTHNVMIRMKLEETGKKKTSTPRISKSSASNSPNPKSDRPLRYLRGII